MKKITNTIKFIAVFMSVSSLFVAIAVLAVTQSYRTNDFELLPGMVVSLSEESTADNLVVKRAGIGDARKLIGISTTIDESLVALSLADRPVFVITDGEVDAYVVDTNGDINAGDTLKLSSIRGVLEKSDQEKNEIIIGTALASTNFDDAQTYKASNQDESRDVRAERIRISVNSKVMVGSGQVEDKSGLAKLGYSITGKNIGEIRVLIALVIFLLVMVAEGGIIYGAISSAITSLGRNPLARKFIIKELIRVLIVAFIVLAMGIAAIYAVLFA
jgi:hypothetical protein